jgi:hypothetical protein
LDQQKLYSFLTDRAADRQLSTTRTWNPFLPFLPMNLADFFVVILEHTKRHVQQIEERSVFGT